MRRCVMAGLGLVLVMGVPAARAADGPSAWIKVVKPMDTKPPGVLARTILSKALTEAGYTIQTPDQAPRGKTGMPVMPAVMAVIEIFQTRSRDGSAIYTYRFEIAGANGRALASDAGSSAKYALDDQAAGLEVLRSALEASVAKLMAMVAEVRAHEQREGRRYELNFAKVPARGDMRLAALLKRTCAHVKLRAIRDDQVLFSVTCRLGLDDLEAALAEGIRAKFSGARVEIARPSERGLTITFE